MTSQHKRARIGRGSSPTRTLRHRLRSVKLVLKGESRSAVARRFGDSFSIVARWVANFKSGGLKAITNRQPPGRPSQLSAAQLIKLSRYVATARKSDDKVSGPRVAEFIKATFGIVITRQQARRIVSSIENHGK